MLVCHFRSFKAIDRVKALWLGPQIERYSQSLDELHTSNATEPQHVRTHGHFNGCVITRGITRLYASEQYATRVIFRCGPGFLPFPL